VQEVFRQVARAEEEDPADDGGEQRRRADARERIAPIYRRLPRGPHRLDPREIAVHQRARIHGAMVEVVANGGYEAITVRRIIGLAGVSRRSFYEQFANRHDCFLRTVETQAARELTRISEICAADAPEPALRKVFERLLLSARTEPDTMRLILLDSLAAGDTGAAALGAALGVAERMLAQALTGRPGSRLPGPIVRGTAGALAGMLAAALDLGDDDDQQRIAARMSATTLAQRVPSDGEAARELAHSLHERMRRAAARSTPPAETNGGDMRERMLESALRLAARQPVARLHIPQIADDAGVSIDTFVETFGGREACLSEALERSGERLLAICERARSVAPDGAQSIRLAVAGLFAHLAANPVQARALALVAHRAGHGPLAQSRELDARLGDALSPVELRSDPLDAAAATGALWHTVRQALIEGKANALPTISDHLSYVLLTPAIGAEAAIAAIRSPVSAAGSGDRRSR
jgi:AcrR family transcriptional regulator